MSANVLRDQRLEIRAWCNISFVFFFRRIRCKYNKTYWYY